jgi:CheY-like chemotaxis protein
MDAGRLPLEPPQKMYASYGSGATTCAGCGEEVDARQVQWEATYENGRAYRMHLGCAAVWEAERNWRRRASSLRDDARRASEKESAQLRGRPPAPGRLDAVRVLVVDDHRDTREMLSAYLMLCGAVVLSASSAPAALLQVTMSDVVVTDLVMSDRDGIWLVGQVQASDRPVPVIAVTGHSGDHDVAKAPFARVIMKPVDLDKLTTAILQVLGY